MTTSRKPYGHIVNIDKLPERYPTHAHTEAFWIELGRAVATFGFLEEMLGKAIFALSATREYAQDDLDAAYEKWLPLLVKAVSDPLGSLIDEYGKVARDHTKPLIENFEDLIEDLKQAKRLRDVICHGSWRMPDQSGRSLPLFVNRKGEIFETPVDAEFLAQLQRNVAELSCLVVNSVTHSGWQFPGSGGPGNPVWR